MYNAEIRYYYDGATKQDRTNIMSLLVSWGGATFRSLSLQENALLDAKILTMIDYLGLLLSIRKRIALFQPPCFPLWSDWGCIALRDLLVSILLKGTSILPERYARPIQCLRIGCTESSHAGRCLPWAQFEFDHILNYNGTGVKVNTWNYYRCQIVLFYSI